MITRVLFVLCFVTATYSSMYAQKDSIINSKPFYWTFEMSSSFLTSTKNIENHKAFSLPTASGSIYFSWNFPVKHNVDMSGFFITPGIGFGANTYCINKNISEKDGVITISNIDGSYEYSYIQGIYIDLPIDFRYLTQPNSKNQNFCFELGGKFGRLIYTEKEILTSDAEDYFTHRTKNSGIMNKYRYGINAKVGFRKIKVNKGNDVFGLALSIIGNYYFSNVFIPQNTISSNSYSVGVGLGFIFK